MSVQRRRPGDQHARGNGAPEALRHALDRRCEGRSEPCDTDRSANRDDDERRDMARWLTHRSLSVRRLCHRSRHVLCSCLLVLFPDASRWCSSCLFLLYAFLSFRSCRCRRCSRRERRRGAQWPTRIHPPVASCRAACRSGVRAPPADSRSKFLQGCTLELCGDDDAVGEKSGTAHVQR